MGNLKTETLGISEMVFTVPIVFVIKSIFS
jgi:hypothetical protein